MLGRPIGKNYLDPRGDAIDFTFYNTTLAVLDPSQSLPSQINIDAGTDFYWVASTITALIAGSPFDPTTEQPIQAPFTVVITDSGSQRQLMNAPVPAFELFGTGQLPYRLILPRLFRANSIIQFQWTSYDQTSTYQVFADLHGFRMPKDTPFNL
jgi:hypothetical protein